jgi:DNA-binding GntR family transcriptional regulator
VRSVKIHLGGQFAVSRNRVEPLSLQLVRQLRVAIESGRMKRGARLPSSRSLARTLGVSRNTVLTAYDELAARGLVRSRRGSGIYVFDPVSCPSLDLKSVMRDAHYPSSSVLLRDPDGNPITVGC